jgi:adenine-specific DNA-methyltransferase
MKKQSITNNIKIPNKALDVLKKNFSHCFDKNAGFDFEKFKQELAKNEDLDFSSESYGMDWLGKSYARLLACDEATTLLKEDKEWNSRAENKNSQNILIKGDNLEVLKHLANAYYEKIKMIYIDPPYNTGSDGFIYQDDRKFSVEELSRLAGIDEDRAKRILDFTMSKSNSHSAWLTFMYPRLYIARQLLKDDGVIFVSIDDNEVAQLRLMMDEIFGEENFVGELPWKGRSGAEDDGFYRRVHEYILIYSKSFIKFNVGMDVKEDEKFTKFDSNKNRHYKIQLLRKWGDNSRKEDRPNLYYSIKDNKGSDFYPKLPDGSDGCWRWDKERMKKAIEENKIEFNENNKGNLEAYEKIYEPSNGNFNLKKYNTWLIEDSDKSGNSTSGTKEVCLLFDDRKVFSRPKPTVLLNKLFKMANILKNDTVLDFFAGSGTTGDAVMQLNAEDKGNRKYILVQIPEKINPKKNKTAYDFVKEELKVERPTIFEITKERIVRAGKKIQAEQNKKEKSFQDKDVGESDLGFKIFETMPIWDDYYFDEAEFDPRQTLFDESKLTAEDLKALLITWKTYDGIKLTDELKEIDLDGYKGHYFDNKLYLLDKNFKTKHLKKLLEEIDANKDFNPAIIIAFGYHFESKVLREIAENVKNYANKKQVDIDFISQY